MDPDHEKSCKELFRFLNKPSEEFTTFYSRECIADNNVRAAFDDLQLYQRFTLELGSKVFLLLCFLDVDGSKTECNNVTDLLLYAFDMVELSNNLTDTQKEQIKDILVTAGEEYQTYDRILVAPKICSLLVAPNIKPAAYAMQVTFAPAYLLGICAYSSIDEFIKYRKPELLMESSRMKEALLDSFNLLVASLEKLLKRAV